MILLAILVILVTVEYGLTLRLISPTLTHRSAQKLKSNGDGREVKFGAIRISDHLSSRLKNKGILHPSGIQINALTPIESGTSCILHAATGTGKTLCFSLPIMSKLHNSPENRRPLQTLVIVPSKELSVQVAADFTALERPEESLVQVFTSNNSTRDDVTSPVVVGTAYKVLDFLKTLNNTERVRRLLCGIDTLVLDEVDRLIPTLGRYATYGDQRKAQEFVNPTRDLIALLNKARASRGPKGKPFAPPGPLQVIACSATVGRPLRRELCNLFPLLESTIDMEATRLEERFPVIRPPDAADPVTLAAAASANTEDPSSGERKATRLVGIPPRIFHRMMLIDDPLRANSTSMTHKLSLLKELWNSDDALMTGILFVPKTSDVEHTAAILKAWRVNCVTDVARLVEKDFSKRGSLLKKPNKVHGQVITDAPPAPTLPKPPRKTILILPLSSSRGLHIPDVDCVMLSQPPKSMDEYLHAAGRTGRMGSARPGEGVVFTVVNEEQARCMRSWQTPLGIQIGELRRVVY